MRKTGMVIGVAVAAVLAIGGLAVSSQQAKLTGSIAVKGNDEAGYAGMAKVSLDEAVQAALLRITAASMAESPSAPISGMTKV